MHFQNADDLLIGKPGSPHCLSPSSGYRLPQNEDNSGEPITGAVHPITSISLLNKNNFSVPVRSALDGNSHQKTSNSVCH